MAGAMFFTHRLDKEVAMGLYEKGYCDRQIADKCDVNIETVREWRKRNNLPGHKSLYKEEKKVRKFTLEDAVREAKKHGMSYGEYMVARREGKVWYGN